LDDRLRGGRSIWRRVLKICLDGDQVLVWLTGDECPGDLVDADCRLPVAIMGEIAVRIVLHNSDEVVNLSVLRSIYIDFGEGFDIFAAEWWVLIMPGHLWL
jgi:hypothetical protein